MAESSGNRFSDLPPGSTLGRYGIVERIGGGGMADIYLAKQNGPRGFERVVALKVMKETEAASSDFTDMFLDEARIAAQLSHPNIVQIFDFGEAAGRLYIAMEYLAGPTLGAVLRRPDAARDPLPFHLGAQAVAGAACGLDFAHRRKDSSGRPLNIVHRDVSPDNLVVTFDGSVKVLDFGIAKAERRYAQTAAGLVKGKLGYMAPEQLRGLELDGRADVYSLGVVLFEALSGAHPFDRKPEAAVAYVTKGGPPPRARARNFAVPEALDELTAASMARDADKRLHSAAELQRLLELWVREKVPAGAESWEHWLGRRFGAQRDERAKRLHTLTGDVLPISVEEPTNRPRAANRAAPRTISGISQAAPPPPPPPARPSMPPTTPGNAMRARLPPKPPETSEPVITFTGPARSVEQSDPSITSPVGRPSSDPARRNTGSRTSLPPPVQSDPAITVAAPALLRSDPVITAAGPPPMAAELATLPPIGADGEGDDTDVSKRNRPPRPLTPARPQPAPLPRKPYQNYDDDDDNIPTQAWMPAPPREALFGYAKSPGKEDKPEPTGAKPLSPDMLSSLRIPARPDTMPNPPAAPPARAITDEIEEDEPPAKRGWSTGMIVFVVVGVVALIGGMAYTLRSTLPLPMVMQQQKTGRVALRTTPAGASLNVDGVARGKAPLELELTLGMHHVVAKFADGGESTGDIELASGGEEPVLELVPVAPEVVDAGPPDAGAPDAGAPNAGSASPDAGSARANKNEPLPGTLNLDTIPPSTVMEGHTKLGETPLTGLALSPGTHKLRMVNTEKHLDRSLKVTIRSGQVLSQRLKLR